MARRDRPAAMPAWLPFTVDTWDQQATKRKRHHFVTHAHTDHIAGLQHFKTRGRTIYCSQITKDLVVRHFPQLGSATFCLLEVDGGEHIIHEPGCRISVRAFDANHCPGAIMLLFYVEEHGYILHTGDARLSEGRVVRPVKAFLRNKPLTCLYLDCTYGNKGKDFPSKEDAVAQVCTFIACQTEDEQQVFLACDQLGMEEVLEGVLQKFGVRFWIDRSNASASSLSWWEDLRAMHPDWLAGSPSATRFHLCDGRALGRRAEEARRQAWRSSGPPPVFIRLSSQFFLHGDGLEGDAETARGMNLMPPVGAFQQAAVGGPDEFGIYRVLFSMHSSRAELMEAVKILSPKHVVNFVGEMDGVLKAVVKEVTKGTANDQWVRPSQIGGAHGIETAAGHSQEENESGGEEDDTHQRVVIAKRVEAPILSLDNTPSLEQFVNQVREAPLSPPASNTSSQGVGEQDSPALERTPQNNAAHSPAARNLGAALDREFLGNENESLERDAIKEGESDLQTRTESRAGTEVLGEPLGNEKQSTLRREGEDCSKGPEAPRGDNSAAAGAASPDRSPTESGEERVELLEMSPSERLRGGSAIPDGGVEIEADRMDVERGLRENRDPRDSNQYTYKQAATNNEEHESDSEDENYRREAKDTRRRLNGLYDREGFFETGYEPRRCELCPRRHPLRSERTIRVGSTRKRRASSVASPKRPTPKKSVNVESNGHLRALAALGVAQPIAIR